MDNLRVARADDFYTSHHAFPNFYFPHLGMRYYTDINNGMVMSKVKKTMSIDDISKELDDAVILVEESEVMRYHKRLTQLGNYVAHKNVQDHGYSFYI